MGHMKVGQRTVPGPTLSAGEMVDPGDATIDPNSLDVVILYIILGI